MTVLIPTVTALPPAPLVTDSEPVFASKASAFVNSLAQFRSELNDLGSTVQDAVAGNLVQFDGFAGVWSAGTFNAGQVVFHTPSDAFYIALEDGETAEPPGGDWRQIVNSIASTAEAEDGTDNTKAITPLRMREGFNATGSAPVYACRAWVKFSGNNGEVFANGNVSSVTENVVGDYTINFTEAMEDIEYAFVLTAGRGTGAGSRIMTQMSEVPTTTSLRVVCENRLGNVTSTALICASIFR